MKIRMLLLLCIAISLVGLPIWAEDENADSSTDQLLDIDEEQCLEITIGVLTSGQIENPSDVLCYKITVTGTEPLFVHLGKTSGWNGHIAVYRGSLDGEKVGDNTSAYDQMLQIDDVEPDTYYITVQGNVTSPVTYTLMARRSLDELVIDTPQQGEITHRYGVSWYQVEVTGTEPLFVHLDKEIGWNGHISVYKGSLNGELVGVDNSPYDQMAQVDDVEPDTYYVVIWQYSTWSVNYTLTVRRSLDELVMDIPQQGEVPQRYDASWYQVELDTTGPLVVIVETTGNCKIELRTKKDVIPNEPPYWHVSGTGHLELGLLVAEAGTYYIQILCTAGGGGYTILATTDINKATKPLILDNEVIAARVSAARACVTSLVFKPGTNQELINASKDRYLLDLGSQDPDLKQYFKTGWQVQDLEWGADYVRLQFAHSSGFENQLSLIWDPDHVEVRAYIDAPEPVEIDNNIAPGAGFHSGADKWAVPAVAGVQMGSFTYPGSEAWIYPSSNPDDWIAPSGGWMAFWNEDADEVHGFTFSEGYELQIANSDVTDLHFMIPAGMSQISFQLFKPKPVIPYEAIELMSGPYFSLTNEVDKLFAGVGAELYYTLGYGNTGTGDATEVILENVLPPELEVEEASISNDGVYDPVGHRIVWNIPSLPAGSEIQAVTFMAKIVSGVPNGTEIVDVAGIRSAEEPIATVAKATMIAGTPEITDISPDRGGNTGNVTVTISGKHLDPVAQVNLKRAGAVDISAEYVEGITDGMHLKATFDLRDKTPGMFDVIVINPSGEYTVLPNVFAIESGGQLRLEIDIVGNDRLRLGRKQKYQIICRNVGLVDIPYVLVDLVFPDNPNLTVNCENVNYPPMKKIPWNELDPSFPYNGNRLTPLILIGLPVGETAILNLTMSLSQRIGYFDLSVVAAPVTVAEFLSYIQKPSESIRLGILSDPNSFPAELVILANSPEQWWNAYMGGLRDIGILPSAFALVSNSNTMGWLGVSWKTWAYTALWTIEVALYFAPEPWVTKAGAVALRGLTLWALGEANITDILKEHYESKSKRIYGVSSVSPEDKYGPAGYDPQDTEPGQLNRFVHSSKPFEYRIDFWNKEDAPVPTQDVFIEDQLDSNLDWDSFEFRDFGFLRWNVTVPPGQKELDETIDLRPDMSLLVRVQANIDSGGVVRWTFNSIDPYTGEPPEDPDAGFLPPITESGYEIGWVNFIVEPKDGLTTGDQISNQAFVKFDVGPWKPAPPNPDSEIPGYGPWVNTIDSDAPTSHVKPLPEDSSSTFTVEWEGTDDEGGSGVGYYTIYVSEDGIDFDQWLFRTSDTSAQFTGERDHTYYFYSRAEDNVGNVEEPPQEPDAFTKVTVPHWTLISIPYLLADNSLSKVLESIEGHYGSIWSYEASTKEWKRHFVNGPAFINNLYTIEAGKGYYIEMFDSTPLNVVGSEVADDPIDLLDDWNLVGYNLLESKSCAEALVSISGFYDSVWSYNFADGGWDRYVAGWPEEENDLETMDPWKGYWINANAPCSWDVNDVSAPAAPSVAGRANRRQVARNRPQLPFTIWGSVEADGMEITRKRDCTVILKINDEVHNRYKLGTLEQYGDYYVIDVPEDTDNSAQIELYVKIDADTVKAANVPRAEAGRAIQFDLSVDMIPETSMLRQNYPNPFNPDTWIPYQLSKDSHVEIRIFSVTGQLARTLDLGHRPAGFYTSKEKAAYWDGRNEAGESVASGVYFYSIKAGGLMTTRKMVVAK